MAPPRAGLLDDGHVWYFGVDPLDDDFTPEDATGGINGNWWSVATERDSVGVNI